MAAIALALGASGCYGVANFLAPLLARRHPLAGVLVVGQLAALTLAIGAVALAGEPVPGGHALWIAVLAGVGNAIGLAGFLRAAQLGPLSVVAPIGATGAVLPVVYGLARGEALRALEAVGLLLAIAGVVLVSRRSGSGARDPAHDLRSAVGWALLSALGFGVLLIALPEASADGRYWSLLDARAAIVAVVAGGAVALRMPVAVPRAAWPALAAPGLLLIGGTLLYLLASERGALSVVSVLASLNPVFTVALAFALLGERLSREQLAGVACAITGVVLIAA